LQQAAATFVRGLNRPSRELLGRAADQAHIKPEDVFLDYLTCDGLLDLAIMRAGYVRWKAGRVQDTALAASFFADMSDKPSAAAGISVVSATATTIDVKVFGAHVHSEVQKSTVKFAPARGTFG